MTIGQDDEEWMKLLLEAGWVQGVLFEAPGTAYGLNSLKKDSDIFSYETTRSIKKHERLVLISHDCDVVSPEEKYVEALFCKKHDPSDKVLSNWDKNSARYFVVDRDAAYVADARHRVKIHKTALLSLSHFGTSMDELRHDRFVQWLARRYDRAIVPDHIYEHFHAPVLAEINRLNEDGWGPIETFNQIGHDIRITFPREKHPPYSVGVVYPTQQPVSEEQAQAIYEIHSALSKAAHDVIEVLELPEIAAVDDVPYGVIRRTQPLFLEYLSWQGGAADPLWKLSN